MTLYAAHNVMYPAGLEDFQKMNDLELKHACRDADIQTSTLAGKVLSPPSMRSKLGLVVNMQRIKTRSPRGSPR